MVRQSLCKGAHRRGTLVTKNILVLKHLLNPGHAPRRRRAAEALLDAG